MLEEIWFRSPFKFRIVSSEHFCINSGFFSSVDSSAFRPLILVLIGVSICALIVCCTPMRTVSTIFFVSADSFSIGKLSHAILLIVIASSIFPSLMRFERKCLLDSVKWMALFPPSQKLHRTKPLWSIMKDSSLGGIFRRPLPAHFQNSFVLVEILHLFPLPDFLIFVMLCNI